MHAQGNVKKGPPVDREFFKGYRSKLTHVERSVAGGLRSHGALGVGRKWRVCGVTPRDS